MAVTSTVHTYPEVPRQTVHPVIGGTAITTQHGYITRREMILTWGTLAEIQSAIDSGESDGFKMEGEPEISRAVDDHFSLYNAVVRYVKYTAS